MRVSMREWGYGLWYSQLTYRNNYKSISRQQFLKSSPSHNHVAPSCDVSESLSWKIHSTGVSIIILCTRDIL